MAPPSIVHQSETVCMKVFDQVVDVSPNCVRAPHVTNVGGVKPMRQMRQAPETGARTTVPKLPLGAVEIADWMAAETGTGCAGAQSARRHEGLPISTAFVESAVNEILSKRMIKKQQMRWNRWTVQPFLDVRVAVLNKTQRCCTDTAMPWRLGGRRR